MASIQEPGMVRMYAMDPAGNKRQILMARVEDLAPAGGAPDGAAASIATPEKRMVVSSPVVMYNDWTLLVTFESDAADGIDVSDNRWSIPVTTPSGSVQLGTAQFLSPALADYTTVAGKEITVAGYKVVESRLTLGPGKIFCDFQDDTA
jgi:hypothetical protein